MVIPLVRVAIQRPLGPSERTILRLLYAAEEPLPGLELIRRSAGALKRGGIYVYLWEMEQAGLVHRREDPTPVPERGGRPRFFYRLAPAGEAEVRRLGLF